MMRPSDEQLMAYADGELPAAEAAAIAALAENDPAVARRIRAFAATRTLLQQSFAQSEVSPRTLKFLREADIAAPRRRRPWLQRTLPMALAASLVAGISALLLPKVFRDEAGPADAALPAPLPASLQAVLDGTPSGVPVTGTLDGRAVELLPLASLQTGDGRYCREYTINALDGAASTSALACREAGGGWTALAAPDAGETAEQDETYRLAGAAPGAAPAGSRRLSVEEERAAIAADWGQRGVH